MSNNDPFGDPRIILTTTDDESCDENGMPVTKKEEQQPYNAKATLRILRSDAEERKKKGKELIHYWTDQQIAEGHSTKPKKGELIPMPFVDPDAYQERIFIAKNIYNGVPGDFLKKYRMNVASGKTDMTEAEMVEYYQKNYVGNDKKIAAMRATLPPEKEETSIPKWVEMLEPLPTPKVTPPQPAKLPMKKEIPWYQQSSGAPELDPKDPKWKDWHGSFGWPPPGDPRPQQRQEHAPVDDGEIMQNLPRKPNPIERG